MQIQLWGGGGMVPGLGVLPRKSPQGLLKLPGVGSTVWPPRGPLRVLVGSHVLKARHAHKTGGLSYLETWKCNQL